MQDARLVVLSFANRLVAVDAHTGQRVWEHEIESTVACRMWVGHELVICVARGAVLCLDYRSGALRWQAPHPFGNEANLLVFAGCVLVSAAGETLSLNLQTGVQLWYDEFKGYGQGGGAMAAPGAAAQLDRYR